MTRMYQMGLAVLVAVVLLPGSAVAQQILANIWHITPCDFFAGCFTGTDNKCHCPSVPPLEELITITNPGTSAGVSPAGDLCADIYVFSSDQQMNECCACKITPDGLLTLGLRSNLLSNPLTGVAGPSGSIRIVASAPTSGNCDASHPSPKASLTAWATHLRANSSANSEVTETAFKEAPFNASELSKLASECGFIQLDGSGHGLCTCSSE